MPKIIGFEGLSESYQRLLQVVADTLDLNLYEIERIDTGKSTAILYLVSLEGSKQVIIKMDEVRTKAGVKHDESASHTLAQNSYAPWISKNITALVADPIYLPGKHKKVAMIYEIAGYSLQTVKPLSHYGFSSSTSNVISLIVNDILDDFLSIKRETEKASPYDVLQHWTKNRLHNLDSVFEDISQVASSTAGLMIDGVVLPNPLLYLHDRKLWQNKEFFVVKTSRHGDLHLGNILYDNSLKKYFLIDFAMFQVESYGFFDIPYLLLSYILLLSGSLDISSKKFLGALAANTGMYNSDGLEFNTLNDNLAPITSQLREFGQKYGSHYGNQDDFWIQYHLAGIATGLIQASVQSISKDKKFVALIFAASHMEALRHRWNMPRPAKAVEMNATVTYMGDEFMSEFDILMDRCDNFSPGRLYIAVIGPSNNAVTKLNAFGRVPWNLVIDFNPNLSQHDQIFQACKVEIEQKRSLHLITTDNYDAIEIYPDRATTYWYGASGLNERPSTKPNTPTSSTYTEWMRNNHRRSLNQFVDKLATNSHFQPVSLLIFWDEGKYIEAVHDQLFEVFTDRIDTFVILEESDRRKYLQERIDATMVPLNLHQFVEGIERYIGSASKSITGFLLPTRDRNTSPREISISKVNWVQELMELVHLDIENIPPESEDEFERSFYQGRKITWRELLADKDIPRLVPQRNLEKAVVQRLENRDASIIYLYHEPGAGGTTLARRIAWDIHRKYPVIILHSADDSNEAFQRLTYIYEETDSIILAIVEASDVNEDQLKSLFDQCISDNLPILFLYVKRAFESPGGNAIFLREALDRDEALAFSIRYAELKPNKRNILSEQAQASNPAERTPFFFGLLAFEENYIRLDDYVRARLGDLQSGSNDIENIQKMLIYLSIAYYFSQQALEIQIFAHLLNLPQNRRVILQPLFEKYQGPLSLLVPENDGKTWRPMHTLVAEEIMRQLFSNNFAENYSQDDWLEYLSIYSKTFVEYLAQLQTMLSPLSIRPIDDLIKKIFIDRDDQLDLTFEDTVQITTVGTKKYSRLIDAIKSDNGKKVIFDALVFNFPKKSHYWAHRGRFTWLVERNYELALNDLDTAINLSGGRDTEDYILHHMRGMAMRAWAEKDMDHSERSYRTTGKFSSDFLISIDQKVSDALKSFAISRELRPNRGHGYISAIQILIRMIEFGYKTSGYDSYGEFLRATSASKYLDYLQEAEGLLDQLQRQTQQRRSDKYIQECEAKLLEFYGDYSRLIEGWQNMLDRGTGHAPSIRRGLVYTYVRRKDGWDYLEERELQRTLELMEVNLHQEPNESRNVWLWFQSARRLNIAIDILIERLFYWERKGNSVETAFYLYVLYAVKTIEGSATSKEPCERVMETCKRLAQGNPNRTRSLEWLTYGDGVGSLIHRSSLGRWDKIKDFYEDTSKLYRVRGTISRIVDRRKGNIELACGLKAFFIPGVTEDIAGTLSLNMPVDFFLGFSYDGLRAWQVEVLDK